MEQLISFFLFQFVLYRSSSLEILQTSDFQWHSKTFWDEKWTGEKVTVHGTKLCAE